MDIIEIIFWIVSDTAGLGFLILAFLGFINLSRRIKELQRRVSQIELQHSGDSSTAAPARSSPELQFATIPPPESYLVASPGQSYSVNDNETPEENSRFYAWLKEDTLVKVGALLLILAVAWFVTYAFANNWIGPVGRITLGLVLGASILVLGVKRMIVSVSQGSIFTVLGAMIAILTISAGHHLYQMFSPFFALCLIFLISVFVAFVSLHFERSQLAYASLLGALVAPFLVDMDSMDPVLFMLYLLLVVSGTLWVVWRLRAEKITLMALLGVLFYSLAVYDLDTGVALLFSFVFTGIFFITNIISLIRRYTEWVSPVHVTTALLTGLYLISSILYAAPAEWQSAYLVFWALAFAYGSQQVFVRTLNKIPFYIYAAVSGTLLGTATIIELDGALLTIVLTLEVLACIMLLSVVQKNRDTLNLATILLFIPGIYSLQHIDTRAWREGFIHADFFALVVFMVALITAGLARNFAPALKTTGEVLLEQGQKVLYSIAAIYGALLIWLVLHSILTDMVATILALVVYSVVGLSLYIIGRGRDDVGIRGVGQIILGLVVLRLLFVDAWDLETTGRIVLFVVIGLLFVSTAFLPKLRKEVMDSNNQVN